MADQVSDPRGSRRPAEGETLEDALRTGGGNQERDQSIANIHTGSGVIYDDVDMGAPPEGAPPPEEAEFIEPPFEPGDPPPPIDPIDVAQEAGGQVLVEEPRLRVSPRARLNPREEPREAEEIRPDEVENRREGPVAPEDDEVILVGTEPEVPTEATAPTAAPEPVAAAPAPAAAPPPPPEEPEAPPPVDPTDPPPVDDSPEAAQLDGAVLGEDALDGDGAPSITQPITVDFGDDGEGAVNLNIPPALEDMGLTSGGEPVQFELSEDGQSIIATAGDEGEPVFTVELNQDDDGNYSYTFELQGTLDHEGTQDGDLIDMPLGLDVTDADGDTASTTFEVSVADDVPVAVDDRTVSLEEGGNVVGSDNGGDNLLANDDLGADGAEIVEFTYVDEDGEQQTAQAGETVDTENGTLTVESDGSWTFESDPDADHSDGAVTDAFTYTIEDGDGDRSSATQNVEITDDGPTIGPPPTDPPGGNDDGPTIDGYSITVDEDNIGGDSTVGQGLNIDFGADGEGSVALGVPAELEDMNLTSGGEPVTFAVSEDGQSIVATTPDGDAVMTVSLNEDGEGNFSYSVDLQGNFDHGEDGSATDDIIGDLPFTLTVTDGDGSTAETTLEVNVVDDAPEALDDETVSIEEGSNTIGSDSGGDNLLANDDVGADGGQIVEFTYVDENGEQQTANAGDTVDTENGTLTVESDGSWSFEADPNADHSDGAVSDSFTYTVEDGDGDQATATQTVEITDDGPTIGPPPTDPPGGGDGGPAVDGYSITVDEDNIGGGAEGSQSLNIDFGADGEGSVALGIPDELAEMNLTSGGEPVTFAVSEDGQSIVATTPDGEPVMTVTLNEDGEGNFSYSVDLQGNFDHGADGSATDDVIGDLPFELTVTDGDGTTASTTLEVNVVDDTPEALDDTTVSIEEGSNTIGSDSGGDNLLANDDVGADGGQIVEFTYTDENGEQQTADAGETVDTENGTLTVESDGSWSFEADPNADHSDGAVEDAFTYTIEDGDGDRASATQTIEIDDDGPKITVPPVDNDDPNIDGNDLVVNEADISAGTDNGAESATALDIDFGADGEGSVALSVPDELTDMGLTSGGEDITFEVSDDGQSVIGTTPDGEPVLTISLDESDGEYSYSVTLDGPVDHPEGDDTNVIGDIPVTLTVTDGDGSTAEATLEVAVVDDVPVAADDETVTIEEGSNTVGSDNGGDNLLANDDIGADGGQIVEFNYTDENGEQQTAEAGETVDTENGTLTVEADGSWSFETDPNADHSGDEPVSDAFTYTIEDGDGDRASATQTIEIDDDGPKIIIPPTDPNDPDADPGSITVNEDNIGGGPEGTQALNIDFGADGEGSVVLSVPDELADMELTSNGEPVTFAVSEDGQSIVATTPDGEPVMTVSLNEDGEGNYSYSVDLQGNFDHGEDGSATDDVIGDLPFTLTVTDGDGSTAETTLEVNVVDDTPVAADDETVSLEEGGNTVGSDSGGDNLLDNDDVGADGGEIVEFTYTDENGEQQTAEAGDTVDTENGTLTVEADGSWSFETDPNADHSSEPVSDAFTYTIEDGDGDRASATQTIEITDDGPTIGPPPTDPPEGPDDPPGGGDGDGPDVDGYSITVDEDNIGGGAEGSQSLNIDFGADGEGSVALSVPDELSDMDLTSGGEPVTFTVSDDGQSIVATTPDGEPVMTVSLNEDSEGNFSYSVDLQGNFDHGEDGSATDDVIGDLPFTLTVTDGDGTTAEATLEVNVVDDTPVALDDETVTMDEGSNTVGSDNGGDNLLANDDVGADGGQIVEFTYTDENGEQQTAEAGETVDTENGTLTVEADGSWEFESDPNADHSDEAVSDGFTYTIEDGDGDRASATQTIEIDDDGPKIIVPPIDNDDPNIDGNDLVVNEADISAGTDNGATSGTAIDIDFGADGEGSVELSVPSELEDMGLTSGGEDITFEVSEDGQSVIGTTPDGEPVLTISLDESDGEYSYSVTLDGPVDHPEGDDTNVIGDIPVTLTVTDGDGSTAEATLEVAVVDDVPVAADDETVTIEEGSNTVGSDSGGDNLLANDDVGADGGEIVEFTYTDENGEQQTAEAGETVDTENGTLTVEADGSWSFESDPNADHSGDEPVSDAFTYTIEDGDGDRASATQTIEIDDDGPKITVPPVDNDDLRIDGNDLAVNEADISAGTDNGASSGTALEIDFGADGEGSVELSVPPELEDMGLTSGGEDIIFVVSDDGQSVIGTTPDGEPVLTISLDETDGEYSYSVTLDGPMDHPEGGDTNVIGDIPVTLTVTDGDGSTAEATLEVAVIDDVPVAADDETVSLEEGGNTVGSDSGGDNLLANDDVGADGGEIVEFTYTDENGEQQTAEAGETVDTENGSLTVEADGSWSFETDPNADHSGDEPVSDAFTYTIEDGDGDRASATQTIEITDDGPTIGPPPTDPPGGPDDPPGGGDGPGVDGYSITVDEDNIGGGAEGSQSLNIDFGADGEGSVELSVPQELEDMNLTSGGEPVTFAVSEDGQSIVATTPDGEPVMTVNLEQDGDGNYSYSVELEGNFDHGADGSATDDVIGDLPFELTVTDGDGTTASTTLEVNVIDDAPVAQDDQTVSVTDNEMSVGSDNGGDNLLANDDLGADGAEITSFTYTDENGAEQTADAGETVDTEHGQLTVNDDGSWEFTSDEGEAGTADNPVMDGFSYTITDGDGDTSEASQEINITDGSVGPIDLDVEDAAGYEDTAIPLDIDVSSLDQDGSEVTTVTIEGVPEGAELSAGTDNGDGTWTLEPDDLEGLSVTPPTDSDVDFDLSVSMTVTEEATGETQTISDDMTVVVDAVADDTTVSADISISGGGDDGGSRGGPRGNRGHGNNADHDDEDNPGKGGGGHGADEGYDDDGTDDDEMKGRHANAGSPGVDRGDGESSGTDGNGEDGPMEVTVSVDATFGDYSDGSEDHFVYVEVPEGWDVPEGYETVDGGDIEGIPDKTFVRVEIDDADLQGGGGSVSVPITFEVPADQDTGEISFDVYSEAVETNLDGGELTEDNNRTLSGDTVNMNWDGSDGAELSVEDAQGYEDQAIPLDIDASLNDADGSEVMSVTIEGVPEGAELSAGTDNGDGTWTLEPDDLEGLTVTPPTDSDADFDLSVSVTATEEGTGQTFTTTEDMTVTVDAVADAPTEVSATYSAEIIPGESETVETSGHIDGSNFGDTDSGFRVVGKDIDGEVSEDNVYASGDSMGVGGAAVGSVVPNQIGHNPETGDSEELIMEFDGEVSELSFSVGRLFQDEGDNRGDAAGDEQGHWAVYSDGELVAEGDFTAEGRHEGTYDIELPEGVTFDELRFSATEYSEGDGTQTMDSSDYFVTGVDFTMQEEVVESEPHCEITVDVSASFGDYTDDSENHYVLVEVPEGWTPVGENIEIVDGGDIEGLPDQQFVRIQVDDDALAAGDGSATVPVTFEAPVPDDDGQIQLDVFAEAVEENLDGGELTEDNNRVFTGSEVVVEKTDMTNEGGELAVEDAEGYEDQAIALDIDASLNDTDGSEVMSITIEDVPEGAELSAGTDNGDGTWTLEPDDLEGLTVTPPTDSDADFDLSVSMTVTETSTGETSVVTEDMTVTVDAVADVPMDVSADVTVEIVPGEPGDPETVEITAQNYDSSDSGFTVAARTIDEDGNLTDASTDDISVKDRGHPTGFGVKGDASNGADSEIGFEDGKSEQVVVNFDEDVTSADVTIAWQNPNEDCKVTVYRDGEPVGEVVIEGGTDGVDALGSFTADDGGPFDSMTFEATGENSDFLVNQIDFEVAPQGEPHCEVTVDVSAEFGDYSDGSEDHFVLVEVPDGWTPVGEGFEVVDGGDIDGLPDQQFIRVQVDDDALAAGDGSATVQVSFEAPVSDEPGEVQLNVFAEAAEVNLDGGELTEDNNRVFVGTDVSVDKEDMTVEDPNLELDDASGLEDTAIPLDIDASLNDTDGSEVMSVTIEDVPEGAELSAGTDNGDGTWTLDAEDLDGLTITPPEDSDVDFDLSVSVTSTETATGETSTITEEVSVEVIADADAPTLEASIGEVVDEPRGEPSGHGSGGGKTGSGGGKKSGSGGGRSGHAKGGGSGSGGGKSNRGHGNNEDGVDDDNPGRGGGGPNAQKEGDGIDEDEGGGHGASPSRSGGGKSGSGQGREARGGSSSGGGKKGKSGSGGGKSGSGQGREARGGSSSGGGKKGKSGSGGGKSGSGQGREARGGSSSGGGKKGKSGSGGGKSGSGQGKEARGGSKSGSGGGKKGKSGSGSGGGKSGHGGSGHGTGGGGGSGGGDESDSTTYRVNLSSELTDTDGSESLSIEIDGVPEGVTFSGGTDNGDGSWSFEPDDIGDLKMTVESDVTADFQLTVTATSTEAENGDSESVSQTLNVATPYSDEPRDEPDPEPRGGSGHGSGAGKSGSGQGKEAHGKSASGGGKSGSGGGKEHNDRGHGNNADGVDDDNPGKGAGGPNALKEADGIDEDERAGHGASPSRSGGGKSDSGQGKDARGGKSDSGQGKDARGGKSDSGQGKEARGGKSDSGQGKEARGGKSDSGQGKEARGGKSDSGQGKEARGGKSDSGQGRDAKGGSGSGQGRGAAGGSGSGQGAGMAAGGEDQNDGGVADTDQGGAADTDMTGGTEDDTMGAGEETGAGGGEGGGDDFMNALDQLSNGEPPDVADAAGDVHLNAGNGNGGDGGGNWFDEAGSDGPPEDDVFGLTEEEQEEQAPEPKDDEAPPTPEDGPPDVSFEDHSLM